MDDEEAKKVLSEVGKLQAQLARQGYSQSDARKLAIEKIGAEKHGEASKIGNRTKTRRTQTQQMVLPDGADVVKQAERIMQESRPGWRHFYATVCKALGWIPSDKELVIICKALNIDTGKAGAANFGNSRSDLRKEGFIFIDRQDGHGYDVRIDKKYTKRQLLLQERERIDAELASLDK
jgi:hypothetical protein